MNRANAYAALASELEACRQLSLPTLVALISTRPGPRAVVIDGEEVLLEVQATWASPKRTSLKITAIAYGPGHLQTERLEEHLTIALDDAGNSALGAS